MENNPKTTIQHRIDINKETLLNLLRQTPIIQVACSKTGIGRATFYRWRKDDEEFSKMIDEAIFQGKLFINDLAESKLIAAIQDQNITAIIFWLKNHHWDYREKLEVTAKPAESQKLTPEQEKIISEALIKGSLLQSNTSDNENHE